MRFRRKKKPIEKKESDIKDSKLESLSKLNFRRDIIGKLWLRLKYFDKRLSKLEEDKQQIFLDNYMASTRQLNRSLVIVILFMIISYMAFAFEILQLAELAGTWIILIYLIFYMARRHRIQNEELLTFLLDNQITPEYARFEKKK